MGSLPSGKNYLEMFAAGMKALMMETGGIRIFALNWNYQMENPSTDSMD